MPEAVAVMGVDNDTILCESLRVPLSSVCHDLEGMAFKAAELLDHLMAGKTPPKEVLRVPPTGLITRRSTDMQAVDNLEVAKAMRFIQDEYASSLLSVDDVVGATKLSRRALERAFRKELNRTVNEEVCRVRLDHVKELLATTTMAVMEIARITGFSRPNHLQRIFRKHFHTSPRNYRMQQRSGAKVEARDRATKTRRNETATQARSSRKHSLA